MSKGKGAAALVVAAVAMMMFFTGCETTKHAEVMSAEDLAKRAQMAKLQGAEEGSEAGGIPLTKQGMGEGTLSVGDGAGAEMAQLAPSEIGPISPPAPTLRDINGSGMVGDVSGMGTIADGRGAGGQGADGGPSSVPQPRAPETTDSVIESFESGPSGYEGQQYVRALKPSDFVPDAPPQPNLGERGKLAIPAPEAIPAPDKGMGTPGISDLGKSPKKEFVQKPEVPGTTEPMSPLRPGDMGGVPEEGSQGNGTEIGHVYFDFDQYVIRADAVSTLQADAQLLNGKYKNSGVLIEGHCDERGTRDYNLVLGERRAQAVKNYLVDLGVSSSRVRIVSYGKERPFCSVSEESCWQKNRRGHIVVQ